MPKDKIKPIYRRQKLLNLAFGFLFSLASIQPAFCEQTGNILNKLSSPVVSAKNLFYPQGLKAEWPLIPGAVEYQYMVTQTSQYEGYDVVATAIYRDWTSVGSANSVTITNLKLYATGPYCISVRAKARDRLGFFSWSDTGVSNEVYLDSVGKAGGEVISRDGKVKLVIPRDALSETKRINVVNIDRPDLLPKPLESTHLISMIQCNPSGITFAKPVQVIYTLPRAEVSGTPVDLVLYNKNKAKIESFANRQTSSVSADGYTVNFSIDHFSTYAALQGMATQGAPIGAGVKIPLPDMFTGSFSHAIPITVPPGRKGMQPNLGLTYRSSNPNSWVGVGFSLNPGYIVRSTRLGPPKYSDTEDTFYFISDAGTTELVHLVDNVYQARIESSFAKFYKEAADDSWRVVNKDGSILRFGQTSESRETSARGTFSWSLTRLTDNNGNYIQLDYAKDSIDNKPYLKQIKYTGNENAYVSPTNTVDFILESRSDIPSSYISGSKIATSQRLKTIEVKVNSDSVWIYDLVYQDSPDTNRSLLKSITQRAGVGEEKFPTQEFTYKRATK